MAIEFNCSNCGKRLSTPDESAGKRARCPDCQSVVDVPASAVPPPEPPKPPETPKSSPPAFDLGGTTPPAGAGPRNPYAAPRSVAASDAGAFSGEMRHQQISFEGVLGASWNFFVANMGSLAILGVVLFGINVVLQLFGQFGGMAAQMTEEPAVIIGFTIINVVISILVQTFINLGTTIFILQILRTGYASVGEIFGAGRFYLRGLGIMILVSFGGGVLAVICIGPALLASLAGETAALIVGLLGAAVFFVAVIWLWLRFVILTFYFLVDRDLGVIETFTATSQFMRGNELVTLAVVFVTGILGFLFVCLTCSLGQILYIPFFAVLLGVIYFKATGLPWAGEGGQNVASAPPTSPPAP